MAKRRKVMRARNLDSHRCSRSCGRNWRLGEKTLRRTGNSFWSQQSAQRRICVLATPRSWSGLESSRGPSSTKFWDPHVRRSWSTKAFRPMSLRYGLAIPWRLQLVTTTRSQMSISVERLKRIEKRNRLLQGRRKEFESFCPVVAGRVRFETVA